MTSWQVWATVGVIALGTVLTRCAPFLLISKSKPVPAWLAYLGRVLPCAVMGLLVVYCLKDVSLATAPHGLPELICIAVVVGLYVWKKNTLLSIAAGTALYMLLVQVVFV
ncbi:MAG: branched-chain amino acid transporter permease [Ruthenibacterium sp.]